MKKAERIALALLALTAAAAVLYIVPLILFFLGYALGAALWQRGGLVGCVAFLLGVGIAAVYDRYMAKHKKTIYTITGFGNEPENLRKRG